MKVMELIEALNKYPQNLEVLITWESTFSDLDNEKIYQAKDGTVILDADENFYKERIMSGELRP